MKNTLLLKRSVEIYFKLIKKYLNNFDINENFNLFSNPEFENMFLWNTIFHLENNLVITHEITKEFYNYFKLNNNNNGYLFSFTDQYKNYSIYNGCYFYINNIFSYDNQIEEFEIISTDDLDFFTQVVDKSFNLNEKSRKRLCKLLYDISLELYSKSFIAYYKKEVCGTITIIECNEYDYYIFNLGILPDFQKLGLSKELLISLLRKYRNKKIFIQTQLNNSLSNSVLPKLGFEFLGSHNIIDISKIYEYFETK